MGLRPNAHRTQGLVTGLWANEPFGLRPKAHGPKAWDQWTGLTELAKPAKENKPEGPWARRTLKNSKVGGPKAHTPEKKEKYPAEGPKSGQMKLKMANLKVKNLFFN